MAVNNVSANAEKMRKEVDTLAKFEAIGNTAVVANKYGVGKSTAHGLKMVLREKGEVDVPVIKADEVKMETTP